MQVRIIAVGKIKERYLADGIAEYVRRLRPYTRLTISEIGDERRPPDPSPAQREQALDGEGKKILAALPSGSFAVALAIDGKSFSSESLATLLGKYEVGGTGTFAFIIGGDLGLSRDVLARCDLRLSLSPMTFTHPMARLILLEQVYRAFRILRGEPYHK
ncbi:MAG TPA: 23S rRNA (pseudouridine(1915)-N(3))-methyltransferase RlmH [Methanoregulaceae archaeon]|nr:23S rRNA (pseudouridine(1915)-N(3))-methyltransferase RlmH [Methanoregulaceae archaeon]